MDDFQKTIRTASATDVMNLVLMTQYFDTLKDLGNQSRTNTIMIPHSPGHMNDLANQIRDVMIAGDQVGTHLTEPSTENTEHIS